MHQLVEQGLGQTRPGGVVDQHPVLIASLPGQRVQGIGDRQLAPCPAHAGAHALFEDKATGRAGRLREAVGQARTAAGREAALRVLAVDPDSRVPERRSVLTPFEC